MNDIERSRQDARSVELRALRLQVLENVNMYVHEIMEMAQLHPSDSGLSYTLWFDEAGKTRQNKHTKPRIKIIMPSGNTIPVSIDTHPEILLKGTQLTKAEKELHGKPKEKILKFISKNHTLIMQHWNGDITTKDLFVKLTP